MARFLANRPASETVKHVRLREDAPCVDHEPCMTRLLSRRALLSAAAATIAAAACGSDPAAPGGPPLRERAAARGLVYGAAGDLELTTNQQLGTTFAREAGAFVPEVSLKWAALRPASDTFDFVASDALIAWAGARTILVRGHALAWHQALPNWFAGVANEQTAGGLLDAHIAAVAGRYSGRVRSWDVVNEALDPFSERDDGLREESPWLRLLGPAYIARAFVAARGADATAVLTLNEYGFENDPGAARKRADFLRLIGRLKDSGTPIQAAGLQAHLLQNNPRWAEFDATAYSKFLGELAAMGLQLFVTELDVNDTAFPQDARTRDAAVASVYRDYLGVALAEPAVKMVTTWGLSDRTSWIDRAYPRDDGAHARPLPLDAGYRRKAAWEAIGKAFDAAPLR